MGKDDWLVGFETVKKLYRDSLVFYFTVYCLLGFNSDIFIDEVKCVMRENIYQLIFEV